MPLMGCPWSSSGKLRAPSVEFYIVADDTCGADDDTCAVVDGEVVADGGSRMYVDAGLAVGHLSQHARDERYVEHVELVSQAVVDQCLDDGIAADHFAVVCRRGVAVEGRHNVCLERLAQARQRLYDVGCDILGFGKKGIVALALSRLGTEAESGGNLLDQQVVQTLNLHAHRVLERGLTDTVAPVKAWEEYGPAQVYDILEHACTGQRVAVSVLMKEALSLHPRAIGE